MAVPETSVIDFVTHNRKKDVVMLVMVESRDWGDAGALLPDLQAKFSAYLTYALSGRLIKDYPAMAGKPIRFELRTHYPPTQREQQFLAVVTRQHLQPQGITFGWKLIGGGPI